MNVIAVEAPMAVGGDPPVRRRWIGPGVISGATANDPSSLVIYTSAGAQLGLAIAWTMLLILPMTSVMQEISARLARATGRGFAANLRQHFPNWLLAPIVAAVLVSNIVTIAADLGAMGKVASIVIGGPSIAYIIGFGILITVGQVHLSYGQFLRVVKCGAVLIAAAVLVTLFLGVHWRAVLGQAVTPGVAGMEGPLIMVVALLGTTISPYAYFWQASLEAEETRIGLGKANQAADLPRLRLDTFLGMVLSTLVGLALIVAAALSLYPVGADGVGDVIDTLNASAGLVGNLLFCAAIIGSGIFGIPMLSGSAGFAVAEWRRWNAGIDHRPAEARPFYGVILISMAIGVALNLLPFNVIDAQIISGVVGAVAVVPVLVTTMLLAANRALMGTMTLPRWLVIAGWSTTVAMAAVSCTAIFSQFFGS
jgi:Mn2+/Fe2+ NRAMP family transporter